MTADPPFRAEDVTGEWLARVLGADGRIVAMGHEPIGTGQVGANVRFHLDWDPPGAGPATVVGKFASDDEASRMAGIATRTYETEVNFYRHLADTVAVRRPHCWFAHVTPGTAEVVLILEDLAPARQGDQIAGCGPDEAVAAVLEAARLAGPRWEDPALEDMEWLVRSGANAGAALYGPMWASFCERYEGRLDAVTLEIGGWLAANLARWAERASDGPRTVVHGDFRLDNILFGGADGRAAVVDWQTVTVGNGTADVAYFIGAGLLPGDRRRHERELVERYHAELTSFGVGGYPLGRCWEDYRVLGATGLIMAVIASGLVGRTERGDEMFCAMANRHALQMADLDTPGLIGT